VQAAVRSDVETTIPHEGSRVVGGYLFLFFYIQRTKTESTASPVQARKIRVAFFFLFELIYYVGSACKKPM